MMDTTVFDSPTLPSSEDLNRILFKDAFLTSPLIEPTISSDEQKFPQIHHNGQDLFSNIGLEQYEITASLPSEPSNQPAFEEYLRPSTAPLGAPDQTPMSGPYNFTAKLISSPNNSRMLYSSALNKVYTDINVDLPFEFSWHSDRKLVVRVCFVFTDPGHAQKRVFTCKQHCSSITEQHIALNMLHSSSGFGTHGVHYVGHADNPDSWLSTIVEFPPNAPRKHAFRFICKNSCASGVNRRATGILFTLEDYEGGVLGRQLLHARCCSCPSRDRSKDERDAAAAPAKRRAPPAKRALPAKLPKAEPGDGRHLPSVLTPQAAVLPRAMLAGWEMMAHITQMAAEACTDLAASQALDESLRSLHEQIDELKRTHDIS